MRLNLLSVLLLTCLSLAACASATAYPGAPQPFSTACDKANEGQQIAVEGYLRLPDTLSGTDSVELRLYPDLNFTGRPIGVTMPFGDRADEAQKITSAYHDDDLKVHLANGTAIPFRSRVRVSGRMYYPVVRQDFACGLENPYVETAK